MEIWVVTGLEGEEFATEGTEVDGEVAGGGRSVGGYRGKGRSVCGEVRQRLQLRRRKPVPGGFWWKN
jgi:hypothetical protein